MSARVVFVTGATGLIAGRTLSCMFQQNPLLRAYVLVRDLERWRRAQEHLGLPGGRCVAVVGDIVRPGLGLSGQERALLRRSVDLVIHAAADTSFSQTLENAQRINVSGTSHLLALIGEWPHLRRYVHLSTAFVAGQRVGRIPEDFLFPAGPFTNAYERSKHEAEVLVRHSGLPFLILRPSTVVCDDRSGAVSQVGAIHRALRVYHAGLASLMPGSSDSPVDVVTAEYVAEATASLALQRRAGPEIMHLCAGEGALPLGELLQISHQIWSEEPEWRRRGIAQPALTDLATYRLFEQAVADTGNARLRTITTSLSHFLPQLAFPKTFETTRADRALGESAEVVHTWWPQLVRHLLRTRWTGRLRQAG